MLVYPLFLNIQLAEAFVNTVVHVCRAEADKAVAQAGLGAFRSVLSMTGSPQPMAGQLAAAASMQGDMLTVPQALQHKKLHLGKKVIVEGSLLPHLFTCMSKRNPACKLDVHHDSGLV